MNKLLNTKLAKTSLVVLTFLFCSPMAFPEDGSAFRNLTIGDAMPAFAAVKLNGSQFKSSGLKGKPAVIAFVKTEQKYSRRILHDLVEIEGGVNKSVQFVIVDIEQDGDKKIAKLDKKYRGNLMFILDKGKKIYNLFGVIATPTTALFDKAGRLAFYEAGSPSRYRISVGLGIDVLTGRMTGKEREDALKRAGGPVMSEAEKTSHRLYNLARNLVERGEYKEALSNVREALEHEPGFTKAEILLGELLIRENKPDKAYQHFSSLALKGNRSFRVKLGLAASLSRLGKYEQALKILVKLLPVKEFAGRLYYERGKAYEGMGEKDKALENYQKAAETLLEQAERILAFSMKR